MATALVLGLVAVGGLFLLSVGTPSHGVTAHAPTVPSYRGVVTQFATHPHVAPHPGATAVTLSLVNLTLPQYTVVPTTIGLHVNTFNSTPINATNTNVSFALYAQIGSGVPYLTPMFSEWAIPVTSSGQSDFTVVLNTSNVWGHEASWVAPYPSWPANARYFYAAWLFQKEGSNPTLNSSTVSLNPTDMVGNPAWASLASPNPAGGPISPGNVTVAVNYGGDYIDSVNVSIYNSGSTLVYSAIVTTLVTGNTTGVAAASWLVVSPGMYTAKINVVTLYGTTVVASTTFNVSKAVGPSSTVYVNTTTYSNTSGSTSEVVPGWSPGTTAAVLLVVGLIIGMIVALALGRMMWGSPPSPPAQAWSGSKSPNECPVCHQSFATEDEMKEHQKTAHGM